MIFGIQIPFLLQLFLFPLVVLGLWHFMFNSQNSAVTKILVEGGYMLIGIPLIVLTFLSIPMMALLFWAPSAGLDTEVTLALGAILGVLILLGEYYWIKRQINIIEEREQMTIWQYLKRQTSSEYRAAKREERIANKEEAADYFDEISEMNRKRRELDREEKEKLRRALLGDLDSQE